MEQFTNLLHRKFYLIKIYITERCNLDCDYCYYKERGFVDINSNDVFKILENIPAQNINGFVLSGGEALLKWDTLKEIIVFIRKNRDFNGQIILQTNGLLITDEKIQFFKEYNIGLEFGFDGGAHSTTSHRLGLNDQSHGLVLKNIQKAAEVGLTYYVSMTVFPTEAKNLYKNFDFLWSKNIQNIDICPAIYEYWDKEKANTTKVEFLKVIKKLHQEGSRQISKEFSKNIDKQAILIMLPTGSISLNYFIMAMPSHERHKHEIAVIKDGHIEVFDEILETSLKRYSELFSKKELTYMDILLSSAELSYPEIKQERGNLNFEIWKDLMMFKQKVERLLPALIKNVNQ